MGQALYRKYRSKSLDEIVGQTDIVKTLKQAIKQSSISHAYLFTGPRGVGKTSVARILAHAINELPYDDESSHIDIIEIDAASNRRIDEIRELREKVYIAPAAARYKVYIIDEVHMLTREAFNALLKTLEEPPAHVVFILATTDIHKVPDTIISRTQRFNFKPINHSQAVAHLKKIAKTEKINISDEALQLLAEHSEGSLRDSESLLDQIGNYGQDIGAAEVEQLFGIPPIGSVSNILQSTLQGGEPATIISSLDKLYSHGYQPSAIARQLSKLIRDKLISNTNDDTTSSLELLTSLLEVPTSPSPERFLEIVLLQAQSRSAKASRQAAVETPQTVVPESPEITDDYPPLKSESNLPAEEKKESSIKSFNDSVWPDILKTLKQTHNTLYSVVRMAEPSFTKSQLTLTFAFSFHQKRLREPANSQLLADIIKKITGQAVKIDCLLNTKIEIPAAGEEAVEPENVNLSAINNIFGNAELLES